jgi:hypothetical protein
MRRLTCRTAPVTIGYDASASLHAVGGEVEQATAPFRGRSIVRLATRMVLCVSACLLFGSPAAFAQDKPYREGAVWSVSFIKVKPGMLDVYMRDLAVQRKKLMDEAKKQGLIVSEKILVGNSNGRDDWDLMLMVEYKNWAAFDGLSEKFDALALKLIGSEEKQVQLMVKRADVREILGDKTLQELVFK